MRSSMLFPRIASKVKGPLGTQRYLADFVKSTDKLGGQSSVGETIKALKEKALPGETVDVRGKIKILAKKRRDLMKNFKPQKYDEHLSESIPFNMASGVLLEKNTPEKFIPKRSSYPEKVLEETDEEILSKLEDDETNEITSADEEIEEKSTKNVGSYLIEDSDYDELARLDEKDFLDEKMAESVDRNEQNLNSQELEEELLSIEDMASTAAAETNPLSIGSNEDKLNHFEKRETSSEDVAQHKDEKIAIRKYEDIAAPKDERVSILKDENLTVPKDKRVAVPKDKGVVVPKDEIVSLPKREKVVVPENEGAAVPKSEEVVVLRNEKLATRNDQEVPVHKDKQMTVHKSGEIRNKGEEVIVPKDKEIPARKDKKIAMPKDEEVSVLKDEDRSSKRAAVNNKGASVGEEKSESKILTRTATLEEESKGLIQDKTVEKTRKEINPKATEQTDILDLDMIDLTHTAKKKHVTPSDADLKSQNIKDRLAKETDKFQETKVSEQWQTEQKTQKLEGRDHKKSDRPDETKIPESKETEIIVQKLESRAPKETDKPNFNKQKETELLPQRMENKVQPATDKIDVAKSGKQKENDQILKESDKGPEAMADKQKQTEPTKQKDNVDETNLAKPNVKSEAKVIDQRVQVLQPLQKPELDETPRITDNNVDASKQTKNKNKNKESMESKKSEKTPNQTTSQKFGEFSPDRQKTFRMSIVKQRNLPPQTDDQKNKPPRETSLHIPEQDLGAKFKEVHKQLEAFSKVQDSNQEVKKTLPMPSPAEIQTDIIASMQKKLDSFRKQVLPQITGPLSHEDIKRLTRDIVSNFSATKNKDTIKQTGEKKDSELVADLDLNTTSEMHSNQDARAAHVENQKSADVKSMKKSVTPTSNVDNDNLTTFIADDLMEELNTFGHKRNKDFTSNSMTIMSTSNQDYVTTNKAPNTPETPEHIAEPKRSNQKVMTQGSAKNVNIENLNLRKKDDLTVGKKQVDLQKPISDTINVSDASGKTEKRHSGDDKVRKATSANTGGENKVKSTVERKIKKQSNKEKIETQQSSAESSKVPVKVERIKEYERASRGNPVKESEIIGYELKPAAKSNKERQHKKTVDIPQTSAESSKAPEKVKSNKKSNPNDMVRESDMFSKEMQTDSANKQTNFGATEVSKMPRKPEQVYEKKDLRKDSQEFSRGKVMKAKKLRAAEERVKDPKAKNPISEGDHLKKKEITLNDSKAKKCNVCGAKMEPQSKEIKEVADSKVAATPKDAQSKQLPSQVTDTNNNVTRDSPSGKPSDQTRKFYKGHTPASVKKNPMDILPENQAPRKNVDLAQKPLEVPVKIPNKPSIETEPTGLAVTKSGQPPVGMPKSDEGSPSVSLGKLEMRDSDTWFPIREGFMSPMRDINNHNDKSTREMHSNQESRTKLTETKKQPADTKLNANDVIKLAVSNEQDFVDILQSIKESGPSVIPATDLQTEEPQSNQRELKEDKAADALQDGEVIIGASSLQPNVTEVSKETVLSYNDLPETKFEDNVVGVDTSLQTNVEEPVEENPAKMSLTTRTKKEDDVIMEAALMRTILKEAVEESLQRIGKTLETKREDNAEVENLSTKKSSETMQTDSNKEESFALVRKFFSPSQQPKSKSVENLKEIPRKPMETVPLTRVSLIDIITERMKVAESQKKTDSTSPSVAVPESDATQSENQTTSPKKNENSNDATVMGSVTTDKLPEECFFDVSKKPAISEKKKLAFSKSSNKKLTIGILNPGTSKELQKPSTAPSGPTASLMQSASERDDDKTTAIKKLKSAMFNFTYDHFWSYFKPTQAYKKPTKATITISKTKPRQPIRLDGKLVISKKKE